MSKAVWTMLVLVMASFTGCLGSTDDVEPEGQDDNPSTQQQSGGGDGGDNDTEDDDIFLQALQNLTSRINDLSNKTQDLIDENELLRESVEALTSENEELQDTMTNLEFYQYDAPASSVVYIYDWIYDTYWSDEYDWGDNETSINPLNQGFSLEKKYRITKDNNTITIDYIGPLSSSHHNNGMIPDSPSNCTNSGLQSISFLNADGSIIEDYWNFEMFMKKGATVIADCELEEWALDEYIWKHMDSYFWSSITVELPEEPERFIYYGTTYTFA
ncbi:MAG: hypothetical protein QGG54_10690 [Gammaproteobacteria bacterium]|jgi:hypothetical protein|nr:hypothetical protein [Gammaproteobacteria bacterium]